MKNKIFKCSVDTNNKTEISEFTGEFMLCKSIATKTYKEYRLRFTGEEGDKSWWNICKEKNIKWLKGIVAPWFDGEWEDYYSDVDSLPQAPENCVSMGMISAKYSTPFLHIGTLSSGEFPEPCWILKKIIDAPEGFTYRDLSER